MSKGMTKQQIAQLVKKRQEDYDDQLQQVREIELKARFWKAQYEIRHYTLAAEDLQKAYDEYVEAQRVKNQKAREEYEATMKKLYEQANPQIMTDVVVTQEMLDMNPEMVEAGVKVGETIQIPEKSDLTPEEEEQALAEIEKEHPEIFNIN